jgi:AcrR family transcriptional regulator
MARRLASKKSTGSTAKKAKQSRADTERRLIDAALDLLRRNGVLAGLNLREVADRAGVNRGNIYHYFGSRQELLRAAITRRFEAVIDSLLAELRAVPFVERRLRIFRSSDEIQDSQLRALLVIDGDETVDPMPRFDGALSQLRQDVIDGDIDRAHDLEALQVALSALSRGYRIFREPYAKRIDTDVDQLDERVAATVRTWLEAMAEPPATARSRNPQPSNPE